MNDFIYVKGARVHNLKNIDVKIPKNSLTVITGLSGSGSLPLLWTQFTLRGRGATWNPSQTTPGSSLES